MTSERLEQIQAELLDLIEIANPLLDELLVRLIRRRFQKIDSLGHINESVEALRKMLYQQFERELHQVIQIETRSFVNDPVLDFQDFIKATNLRPYNHQKAKLLFKVLEEDIPSFSLEALRRVFVFLDDLNLYLGGIIFPHLEKHFLPVRKALGQRLKSEQALTPDLKMDPYLLKIARVEDNQVCKDEKVEG